MEWIKCYSHFKPFENLGVFYMGSPRARSGNSSARLFYILSSSIMSCKRNPPDLCFLNLENKWKVNGRRVKNWVPHSGLASKYISLT